MRGNAGVSESVSVVGAATCGVMAGGTAAGQSGGWKNTGDMECDVMLLAGV